MRLWGSSCSLEAQNVKKEAPSGKRGNAPSGNGRPPLSEAKDLALLSALLSQPQEAVG